MQPDRVDRGKRRDKMLQFFVDARKKIICVFLALIIICLIIFFVIPSLLNKSGHDRGPGKNITEKSLLVLPFKNMNINDEDNYFADGISENIINSFFMIRDMKVISKSTAEHFQGNEMIASEIAGKLKVRYVLDGNVHKDGKEIKIIVELLDVAKNQHIMSEKFEGDISEIFILQSEIVKIVAEKIGVVPSYDDIQLIEKIPTQDIEAYDYYLRAKFLYNKANFVQQTNVDMESLTESLEYFEKAVSADTAFAGAYAGLANVWFALASWDRSDQYQNMILKAEEFSKKAMNIDPYCAEAHAVRGACLIWPERKYEEGRMELLISHQLNPNFPVVDLQYTQLLLITGPIDKARLYINQAMEREPYSWILHNLNSWVFYFEKNYSKSIDACKIALEFNPGYIFNNWLLFLNYTKTGEGEAALKELQLIAGKNSESAIYENEIQKEFYKSGILGLFQWMTERNVNNPINLPGLNGDPFFISWWYAIMGEKEKSLTFLEKSLNYAGDFAYLNSISNNPDFDFLRDDPRFLSIIDNLGLTPYNNRQAGEYSVPATAYN
jgi:TolB-like protein/tetratricopeptide (TPR) repeat protein